MSWLTCHPYPKPEVIYIIYKFSWSSVSGSSPVVTTAAYGRTQPRGIRVRRLHRSSTLSRQRRRILCTLTRCILSVTWQRSLETWMYRVYRAESTDYSDQDVHTCYYRMYTHVVTGCTLTLVLDVQNLEMYKLKMYKTGNVQPRATECIEN